MKRTKKYYKKKRILEIKRKLDEERSIRDNTYWKDCGYTFRLIPSRAAKKHPLYKELIQVLPLVADKKHFDKLPDVEQVFSDFDFDVITMALYLKLSSPQKMCFEKDRVIEYHVNSVPVYSVSNTYKLIQELKDLLVPQVTKRYVQRHETRIMTYLEHKIDREHLDPLINGRWDYWGCEDYAKISNKDLLKLAREEILELS